MHAVTCHKAQGGQWKNVFLDQGYVNEERNQRPEHFKRLYTAFTRAILHAVTVNHPKEQTEAVTIKTTFCYNIKRLRTELCNLFAC